MNEPKVSVVIPVYNAETTIAKCIDSVLAQTYPSFELLLVDDGSTDGGGAICQAYAERDPRIRYIKKENGGVSTARNRGIDESKGEYITFLDSDDWFEPITLERLVASATEHNADLVIPRTRMYYCKPDGSFDKYVFNDDDFDLLVTRDSMAEHFETLRESWALYSTCGRLYRRAFLTDHHLQFDIRIKVLEDFCFNLSCLQEAETVAHISDVLYNFYVLSVQDYAYKRHYQGYIVSNEQVFLSLRSFNESHGLSFTQEQYDFLMSYWVMALNAVLATEKNRKKANESIRRIAQKVEEEGLYEHCTKEGLDRQYHVLFRSHSPFLFKTIVRLKRLKSKLIK